MSKNIKKRKACFLCTTPFQVWGAVALRLAENQESDIVIIDDLKDYEKIARGLKQTGLFGQVYTIPFQEALKNKGKLLKHGIVFFRMLFSRRFLNRYMDRSVTYETILTSSSAVSKSVVFNALLKRNPQMKTVLYDDGTGSYSGSDRLLSGSFLFQKSKRLLGWKEYLQNPDRVLLYRPELTERHYGVEIEAMPRIRQTEENLALLQQVFHPEGGALQIREKVILFDTFRQKEEREDVRRLDECFERILATVGGEELILKAHPRSTVSSRIPLKRFPGTEAPIELVYAQQKDIREKILIAINSTALFSPKMLFGWEPRIMLLYRLVTQDAEVVKKREKLYRKLCGMYEDPERISIPESFEEMDRVLKSWITPPQGENRPREGS